MPLLLKGDIPLNDKLLANGASPLQPNPLDDTAVDFAILSNDQEIQDLVLNYPNPKSGGITPLMAAINKQRPAMVRKLLDNGANPLAENKDRETAIDFAISSPNREIKKLIANYIDANEESLLKMATPNGRHILEKLRKLRAGF